MRAVCSLKLPKFLVAKYFEMLDSVVVSNGDREFTGGRLRFPDQKGPIGVVVLKKQTLSIYSRNAAKIPRMLHHLDIVHRDLNERAIKSVNKNG